MYFYTYYTDDYLQKLALFCGEKPNKLASIMDKKSILELFDEFNQLFHSIHRSTVEYQSQCKYACVGNVQTLELHIFNDDIIDKIKNYNNNLNIFRERYWKKLEEKQEKKQAYLSGIINNSNIKKKDKKLILQMIGENK